LDSRKNARRLGDGAGRRVHDRVDAADNELHAFLFHQLGHRGRHALGRAFGVHAEKLNLVFEAVYGDAAVIVDPGGRQLGSVIGGLLARGHPPGQGIHRADFQNLCLAGQGRLSRKPKSQEKQPYNGKHGFLSHTLILSRFSEF
jgi:hypothetical protein